MRLRFSIVAAACLLAAACGQNGITGLGTHLTSSPMGGSDIKIGASMSVADTAANAVMSRRSSRLCISVSGSAGLKSCAPPVSVPRPV